ncbi:MAG: FAD-binding oxidoreductase [Candidatus Marsarchaeota archaeon]|jgi:ferredoxin-NADP reductase|nr:FAD-binding oxidoreductase [Candidatus Marsarchaeota archaeon]MCL5418400.1 FAD-binding oxidoreductase [Candidatus Marsarchaeota archaeon]
MEIIPLQIKEKPYVITFIGKETPEVTLFRFNPQDNAKIKFDPGMFVMVEYANASTKEKISRAFSIASSPTQPYLEFFISMIHGRFTSHLDTAKEGDIYYITGPYGQFRFVPSEEKKVLFLAGGTGLAPFMSMLRQIRDLGSGNDIVLIYSVKYPTEIIRKEELDELEKALNLKTVVTVTRPQEGDGWSGEKGHISADTIRKYAPDFNERTVYVCGPLGFVKAMKDAAEILGIDTSKLKADVWG